MLSTGTSTTYSAVTKPAFDAVVYATPICCAALAAKSTVPAAQPASRSVLRSCGVRGRRLSVPRRSWKRSNACTTGVRNATAIQLRPARYVYGPTRSAPMACATNVVPHSTDAIRSMKMCDRLFIPTVLSFLCDSITNLSRLCNDRFYARLSRSAYPPGRIEMPNVVSGGQKMRCRFL